MKIYILFLCLICCFCFVQVSAQFSVGVRGGVIKAWQEYGDVNVPPGAKIHIYRFQGAAIAYFELIKHVSVGLEPGFVQRGAACEPGFLFFNQDTKLRLNYLDLPLMITVKFPVLKNKFEFFGKVGYGASYLVSASRSKSDLGSDDPPVKSQLDVNDKWTFETRWDQGYHGGLGICYNAGKNQLFLESNYYSGSKDIIRFTTSKNRSIHLGMGYLIRL